MKIALIYPSITIDGFAKENKRPTVGWIHHGLGYISAALKKEGHEVFLIDLRQLTGWDELESSIRLLAPDVAGITMMSLDFDAAIRSAEIIKEVNPSIKVVVGGAHPTLMEEELINIKCIDHIFKGEAEIKFPKILKDLVRGDIEDKIIHGEAPDLDKISFIDRSLFSILEAPIVPFLKMPHITAIAGRGCTYNCSFCQPAERKMFGQKVRRMSAGRFMEELEVTASRSAFNSLMIHDDCLAEDASWIEGFLKQYRRTFFRKPFVCQARADIIVRRPKLFKDMRKHGLAMLLIGFESGNQRILNLLRKGATVEDNYNAACICKKLGIRVWANFMMGIPTETNQEVMDTVEMIKRIKPYVPSPAFYTPHPGSDLYDFCKKNDLSLIKKHGDYRRDPTGPKIKGVDYEFLNKALSEVTEVTGSVKFIRKIDRLRLGRFNKELIARHAIQE